MHSFGFVQDLAVVMVVAGGVTILFNRLGQPVVLGYILAGLIIGPYTPPFSLIHNEESIHALAELGILFLMFSLGLHFRLKKMLEVGATALVAAILEILGMAWLGYEIGYFFGWGMMNSLFLGGMLAISSTTIIVKALADLGKTREKFATLIFGILIMEDILAIALLALLSSIAMTGTLGMQDLLHTLMQLGIFLVVLLVTGYLLVPPLLRWVARFKSQEILLVTVLGLCFGVSMVAKLCGYSIALGAFLIGAIIAETKESQQIDDLIAPIRDFFSVLFFVAVGLMINPHVIVQYAWPIGVITVAVLAGKVATCSFGSFVAGQSLKDSFRVGMGMAQIGEFSFIIASLGLSLKVTDDFLYPIAVAVSVVTTFFTPYMIRYSDSLMELFRKIFPKRLTNLFNTYTQGLARTVKQPGNKLERSLWRKNLLLILLNMVFVSAIFIGADSVDEYLYQQWPEAPAWLRNYETPIWFVSMLLSLPLLSINFRYLKKLALASAGSLLNRAAERKALTSILVHFLWIGGTILMGLWILLLSATLFPGTSVLGSGILILAVLGILLGKMFTRHYTRAVNSLKETLSSQNN